MWRVVNLLAAPLVGAVSAVLGLVAALLQRDAEAVVAGELLRVRADPTLAPGGRGLIRVFHKGHFSRKINKGNQARCSLAHKEPFYPKKLNKS